MGKVQPTLAGFSELGFAFPQGRIIIAGGGHESRRRVRHLKRYNGYMLRIVKRRQRALR